MENGPNRLNIASAGSRYNLAKGDVIPKNWGSSIRVRSPLAPLLKEYEAMKRSRFTEVQVAYALRQAEAGPDTAVCISYAGGHSETFQDVLSDLAGLY